MQLEYWLGGVVAALLAAYLVYALVILALTKPVGLYLYRVFEGERRPLPRVLGRLERLVHRLSGVDPARE